ncbi:DUF4832 domain-containing protein [Mucilaginibacter sp. UR6-11]|uniref:DUF4832 domain-containing protein n=1 Tax=Mucilaginibacter sp. UR6-11 TaxID=1435644 RepID=UPI001E56C45D|nr:DUF4832 domain-containing protein [Mucilaginibacter sp. UR6-11]MCC8423678.1 DUF4832 domain-containing protein [Mucilaginibacter sp. UR6-11]
MMKMKNFNKVAGAGAIVILLCCGIFVACKKSNAGGGSIPPVVTTDDGIKFEQSTDIFPNPERGFTKTYTTNTPLDPVSLNTFRVNLNTTLIVRVFYLSDFKNKAIDQAYLNFIQTDLNTIRNAGLKGVVRFAYTETDTDAPLAIVQQHMDQLKPVLEANKDVIAFVQAGFIGDYGEWHDSTNGLATPDNEKTILTKLLSVVPTDIMVQVRTPLQKQQVFGTAVAITAAQGYSGTDIARVGQHNDCFLSSTDDYGTYANVALEKQYVSNEALYVPVGGETCPPIGGYSSSCDQGRTQMKLLRWTYLNMDYYQPTLNGWKTSGCFDEFLRNLGYRLALVNAVLPAQAAVNGNLKLGINITNVGYAPLYNKKTTSIILKNTATGTYYEAPLTYDIRGIKPATTVKLDESVSLNGIPAGTYALYLRIADQAPGLKGRVEYAVRLANKDTWVVDNGGMNDLKSTLKIM